MRIPLTVTVALALLAVSFAPSQTSPEDWENPRLVASGTERARANFVPFPDAAAAVAGAGR